MKQCHLCLRTKEHKNSFLNLCVIKMKSNYHFVISPTRNEGQMRQRNLQLHEECCFSSLEATRNPSVCIRDPSSLRSVGGHNVGFDFCYCRKFINRLALAETTCRFVQKRQRGVYKNPCCSCQSQPIYELSAYIRELLNLYL